MTATDTVELVRRNITDAAEEKAYQAALRVAEVKRRLLYGNKSPDEIFSEISLEIWQHRVAELFGINE